MLIFVVPLQSPAVSRDWQKVSRLAERTLRSICAQTCAEFRVILVCNQRPAGGFTHPALTIIEDDFPTPGDSRDDRMIDKGRKILRAVVHARQWAPLHLMLVDADDCVSRELARFVEAHRTEDGWHFHTGYVHDQHSRWVLRKHGFHLVCGTSHILRCEAEDLPAHTAVEESDFWVLSNGHPHIVNAMKHRGTPLAPLPFIGSIYNTATGENFAASSLHQWYSRRMLFRKFLNFRPLTTRIRNEFGLTELPT